MRFPALGVILFLSFFNATGFAQDQNFEDFGQFENPVGTPLNAEAEKLRIETNTAYQRGDFKKVIELANRLLASYPSDFPHFAYHMRASAQIELGRQARSSKQIREGVSDARTAIGLAGTKHPWLYIPYLYGLTSLSEVEKRHEHAEMAIKTIAPVLQREISDIFTAENKADLLYQRALAHTVKTDLKAATIDYTEAIRLNPKHLGSHLRRAEALAAQNRGKETQAAYDEAVKLFPETVVVINNRGNYRRLTGNLDGAVADFAKALELDPAFGVGFINRGWCLADQNKPQDAKANFDEALKHPLDPSLQFRAYNLRALANASLGDADAALADYDAAVKIAPKEATIYEERACAQFFKKDFAAAANDFAKALELNPKLGRLVPFQTLTLLRAGKTAEARTVLDTAAKTKSAPHPWLAKLEEFLADQIDAQDLLKAAAEMEPAQSKVARLCEARFFIGQKKLLAGEADAAAEQFREAIATNAFAMTAYRGARFELGDFAGTK
ncbi:MAG: tetratricopeptide repeat protein [Planctomycetaceae bacterium]|nr:tetratricopeptide repeat protein [Planctomycetaceae bacterium]